MSNSTPEEQKKLWLELALQKKRLSEEEGKKNEIISALSSRVPVLIFSKPKRTEILMAKKKKKRAQALSSRFQNMLLDQFVAEQQEKLKEEADIFKAKNKANAKELKFLEMPSHHWRGSQPKKH